MDTLWIAEQIQNTDPAGDRSAAEAAKTGILDYLASSFLAEGEEELDHVYRAYRVPGGVGIVTGLQPGISEGTRAVINGFRAHLLDIDDVHSDVRGHPGAVILSALFAAAEPDCEGADFLNAYIAGVEVMARLGESVNPGHYLKGWHNTATLGGIAAAAALARLFHLSPSQTAQAMGIAATQTSGFRAQFGTPVKALHVGFAARSGVEAVKLVREGIYGEPDPLYKRYGFYDVFGPQGKAALEREWGRSWKISSPGLWLKKYPFCSAALPGADAAMALGKRHGYRTEEIREIEIGFFPGKDAALYARRPETGEQGRFSIEYIVWLGLSGTAYDLPHFSKAPIGKEIREALERCRRITLGQAPGQPYTQVTVVNTDGSRDVERVIHPKGSPENPLSIQDEKEKLSAAAGGQKRAEEILKDVMDLEKGEIRGLLTHLNERGR